MPLSEHQKKQQSRQISVVVWLWILAWPSMIAGYYLGWSWTEWLLVVGVANFFLLGFIAAYWGSREWDVPPMEWWEDSVFLLKDEVREDWRRGWVARVRLAPTVLIGIVTLGTQWIAARAFTAYASRRKT